MSSSLFSISPPHASGVHEKPFSEEFLDAPDHPSPAQSEKEVFLVVFLFLFIYMSYL